MPRTCCVTDSNGLISDEDLGRCQTTRDGPPERRHGSQYSGPDNTSLHYRVSRPHRTESSFIIRHSLCVQSSFDLYISKSFKVTTMSIEELFYNRHAHVEHTC